MQHTHTENEMSYDQRRLLNRRMAEYRQNSELLHLEKDGILVLESEENLDVVYVVCCWKKMQLDAEYQCLLGEVGSSVAANGNRLPGTVRQRFAAEAGERGGGAARGDLYA